MSVGYWRALNGVPVRSLQILRQARRAKVWKPSELRQVRRVVAVESQCGQLTAVSSSLRGRGYATPVSPEI